MTLNKLDTRPWYKERWPWFLMAGPGIVIIAGIYTTRLAIISNDGLVSDDYYKQGLTVNQQLHRDHQASVLGLSADVMRSGNRVRMLVLGQQSVALPDVVAMKLAHPTQAGQDQIVQMRQEGQGMYAGQLTGDVAGRWNVSIEDPAGQWRLQGVWQTSSEEPLRLQAKK